MIERYTRSEMGRQWTEERRFQNWLKVELAVTETLSEVGIVPRGVAEKIRKAAKIDVKRINFIEESLRHDVIAFTTSIAEQAGDVGRYFHFGLTSSDIVDTALALQLRRVSQILLDGLAELELELKRLALKYKSLATIGRTHGIHAEPTSFGLKFLGWLAEVNRQRLSLKKAKIKVSFGKLSGAVGAYGVLSPDIERRSLGKLKLISETVSTQVIPRDRHADFVCTVAQVGATIERIAVELRHLQRTEVSEVEEGFGKEQKGSSAMPHKKNPISAENLTGCARVLRGYAVAALENVALWHERDISHSSVERVVLPDATILLDYMIHRLVGVLRRLNVNEGQVHKNLMMTQGVFFSGHVLLELVKKGVSREDGYRIVQSCAHAALEQGKSYRSLLEKNVIIRQKFSAKELDGLFDLKRFLKHVDEIYRRVLNSD